MKFTKNGRVRDYQRQRVYDADIAGPEIFDGDIHKIRAWVWKITSGRWWKSQGGRDPVQVKDGRGCRNALAWKYTISLPRWARTKGVILHEIAHCLTAQQRNGRLMPSHGATFCRNYIRIVRRWWGRDAADALRDSFKKHKVRYRPTAKYK